MKYFEATMILILIAFMIVSVLILAAPNKQSKQNEVNDVKSHMTEADIAWENDSISVEESKMFLMDKTIIAFDSGDTPCTFFGFALDDGTVIVYFHDSKGELRAHID